MALELRQNLKLSQQLVMTPQLQQAIKLLQLSRVELVEAVQQELEENPFLEEAIEKPLSEGDLDIHKEVQNMGDADISSVIETMAEWEDYLGDFSSAPKSMQNYSTEISDDLQNAETRCSYRPSLEGHLMWQLRLADISDKEIIIGEYIIGNLSHTGYLELPTEVIAKDLCFSLEAVHAVLERIHFFDPIGIAASSPEECLLLQLQALQYDSDITLVRLVTEHLSDLEKKKYKIIMRSLSLNMDKLKEYLEIIQILDPMPGASFIHEETAYVTPDVYVCKYGEEFHIHLNEEGLPHLRISEHYDEKVFDRTTEEEKGFLQDKVRSASWLIRSLHQRQKTLHKVMESIVKYQYPFFEEGPTKLRPLVLRDIADDIGMHESTVSRITTNKFVATSHGIYELKYFFNSAIDVDNGNQIGSESVKALIKRMVAEENPKSPLSDEKIVDLLKERLNINIARRTVAKYRIALDIPSSLKRKDFF
ncbi:MAG: RNA polymerase factor sigma-54 [Desulfovibrionaceae bacterium]